jgi:ABC-type Mn2+/Zn2+ transport system permease subunit
MRLWVDCKEDLLMNIFFGIFFAIGFIFVFVYGHHKFFNLLKFLLKKDNSIISFIF